MLSTSLLHHIHILWITPSIMFESKISGQKLCNISYFPDSFIFFLFSKLELPTHLAVCHMWNHYLESCSASLRR